MYIDRYGYTVTLIWNLMDRKPPIAAVMVHVAPELEQIADCLATPQNQREVVNSSLIGL